MKKALLIFPLFVLITISVIAGTADTFLNDINDTDQIPVYRSSLGEASDPAAYFRTSFADVIDSLYPEVTDEEVAAGEGTSLRLFTLTKLKRFIWNIVGDLYGSHFLSWYDDLDEALTAIGSTATTLYINEDVTLAANTTTPSTLSVKILPGVEVDTTDTLTVNGSLDCDGSFTGTGGIDFSSCLEFTGSPGCFGPSVTITGLRESYPDYWTANTIPGTTNMASAIGKCGASVRVGGTVKFKECTGYAVESAVVIPISVNVDMQAPIMWTGGQNDAIEVLTIGDTAETNSKVNLNLQVVNQSGSVMSDFSNDQIGVKLINIQRSYINTAVGQGVKGFTRNVVYYACGTGCTYNNHMVGSVARGQKNLQLYNATGGYCNQNFFYGFQGGTLSTGGSPTADRITVSITSQSDAHGGDYYYSNNNVFIGLNTEAGSSYTSGDAIGIDCEYGSYNTFYGVRDEGNDLVARFSNDSNYNNVYVNYGTGTYEDNTTYRTNFIYPQKTETNSPDKGSLIYSTGNLARRSCYADGNTSINIHGFGLLRSTASTVRQYDSGYTVYPTYVQMSSTRGLFVDIDTSVKKRFIYRGSAVSGYGGRLAVTCFDASGNILSGTSPNYVTGTNALGFTNGTNFGNSYRTGTDTVRDIFFSVTDDVQVARVILAGGTENIKLKAFSLYSVDGGSPSVTEPYGDLGFNVATTSPTAGSHFTSLNQVAYNIAPASGQPQGWRCSFRLNTTLNGGEPSGETSMVVASGTGTTNGDLISVLQDDGTYLQTTISSGGGTTTLVLSSPLTDDAASGNAVIVTRRIALPNY